MTGVANNARKLDRYLIISYSSLAPNAEFYVIYSEILQLLLLNFFLFKMFFVYLLRVNNTNKKGRVTVLVSSQKDNKGKISASNDHFPLRDWN